MDATSILRGHGIGASAGSVTDYFGTGADGVLNTTGNVTLPSTLDGTRVVKHYSSITINAGHVLTVSNRCKGLLLYSQGDVIINGSIDMSSKAPLYVAANEKRPAVLVRGYTGITSDPSIELLAALTVKQQTDQIFLGYGGKGGAGGGGSPADTDSSFLGGGYGGGGAGGQSGGLGGQGGILSALGSGGAGVSAYNNTVQGNPGGRGAGGSGKAVSGDNASVNTGRGGNAPGGGGSAGMWRYNGSGLSMGAAADGAAFGGGIIVIIAKGNIIIGSGGSIRANGGPGAKGQDYTDGMFYNYCYGGHGGGGGGGGIVGLFYKGTYTNNGVVEANGGAGGAAGICTNNSSNNGTPGASGTVGTITTKKL
ncbi:hypothetical protein [Brevibacillus sp. SYSU BS000544]|uniref:hypothetical protein n=1 Tax=Brevibacillus sp. SYSU BS000544 TaxID=3416443 RepID=UPI003CE4DDE1